MDPVEEPRPSASPSSSSSHHPVAAAYFGESSNTYFGPHFVVNSPRLTDPSPSRPPNRESLAEAGAVVDRPTTVGDTQPRAVTARWWMDFLWPFRRQPEAAGVPGVGPGWGNGGDKWAVVQDLYRQTPPAEVRGDLSTIQCLVNLKKNTLALDPVTVPEVDPAQIPLPPSVASSAASSSSSLSAVPSGPNADATEPPHIAPRYRLSFTFDSSTSCMVKIHWVAKEVVLERRDGTRQLLYVPKPTLREGVAGGLGAHTMVKRYGPFPAGLHQRFVLPEEDALDTAELRNRLVPEIQLVVGEGTKEEEASVEVEDEENDDSMEEEGEAGASEVVLDIEEGGANGALEGDGEQGTSKRRKSLAAAGTVAETKTAAPAPSHNSVYFPLIIQIESIPSEDESNDLTDLDIAPVHAQSTYVTLIANRDHKSYRLGVVKQRLMVDGVIYTLQDIFGFTDPSGTGSEEPSAASGDVDAEDLQTMRECVVCMSSPKDTAVLPCRHLCLCRDCAEVLRFQGRRRGGRGASSTGPPRCPICRQVFHSLLQITLPEPLVADSCAVDVEDA